MSHEEKAIDTNGGNREPALRSWTNKLLCGLVCVLVAFVGIWATYIKGSMDTFDVIQRSNVERIVRLEESRAAIKDDLIEIKMNQGETQRTLNRIMVKMGLNDLFPPEFK